MKPNYQDKGINFYCGDCMALLKEKPDNYWSLSIVDPPYGVAYARGKSGWGVCNNRPDLSDVKWDSKTPNIQYFKELQRVSVNQIVWGGNYFTDKLPVSKCWIVWNKINHTANKSVFSDAELAWTSFTKVVKMFTLRQMGFVSDTHDKGRIHPTQKPTELYVWLFKNYAKPGDRILDTHGGSGSSAIACALEGFEMDIIEIDEEYFEASIKRFKEATCQMKLFS
uniref:Putative methyltransferase n=1 Tax=viral metagenome TaxID=1070528 RepID=A0A6H1ZQF7_9ZZZZ